MIDKLKAYALAALGVIAAIFAALFYREKAGRTKDKLDGEKAARETENKASDAIIEGVTKENEIQNDNSVDRNKFLD